MSCICYDSRAVPRFLDVKRKFDIWMSNLWFFPCILCQIFTLSAVPFNRMPTAILECFFVLKPGGLLLFRDYGNAQTWITIYTCVYMVHCINRYVNCWQMLGLVECRALWYDHAAIWSRQKSGVPRVHEIRWHSILLLFFRNCQGSFCWSRLHWGTGFVFSSNVEFCTNKMICYTISNLTCK